ncbi:hypothetical protein EG328_009290 [Venturia inaequalis]|uniref:Probable quinone oxidoreductase n=1 Tax=Venturia inaequalis TaxID=5025 RepID=A0A8H3U9Q5_VENIN|nr:hypothetical protein EG328_009290 [Venturia inaequalis]KAE9974159.1 hypothetical protein EG327_008843 [Venturia inaequalis]
MSYRALIPTTHRLTALTSRLGKTHPAAPALAARSMSTSHPKSMEAIIIEKTGGTEVLQFKTDVSLPDPKEGEVLVKNEYVGVNFIDTYFRSGLYPAPNLPYILGRESSGVIQKLGSGNTHSLAVGDRVVALSSTTYAQYTAAPSQTVYKLPSSVSTSDAAAGLLQGLTALTLIREAHLVKSGDWVLVHAAAGGVGLLLIQLLKAVGAKVIATCSTPKIELVKSKGVDVVIDYSKDDFAPKVKEVTGGAGVVAVFDGVGKATFEKSFECVARKGSMVSYGNASGAVPPFTIARLSGKNIKLIRPSLFGYLATREEFETYTKELLEFIEQGKLDIKIHEIYPLKDAARAQEDLEGRRTTGKLLLKP